MHKSLLAPTATSMNNAMRVFRNQQKVLQDNAKALLEKTETPRDLMDRRQREMTSIYAVKNPRTKQAARTSKAAFNVRESMVTAKESLQTVPQREEDRLKFVGQSMIFNSKHGSMAEHERNSFDGLESATVNIDDLER